MGTRWGFAGLSDFGASAGLLSSFGLAGSSERFAGSGGTALGVSAGGSGATSARSSKSVDPIVLSVSRNPAADAGVGAAHYRARARHASSSRPRNSSATRERIPFPAPKRVPEGVTKTSGPVDFAAYFHQRGSGENLW